MIQLRVLAFKMMRITSLVGYSNESKHLEIYIVQLNCSDLQYLQIEDYNLHA